MKKKNRAAKSAASDNIKATRRQERERLSDAAVLVTSLAVLYAILLLFLQNMGMSGPTAMGALTFEKILFWGSIAGAIFFAVWAAYKERKGLMLYTGIFLFVLWTITIILYGGNVTPKFALVYASILIAVVLFHIGIRLRAAEKNMTVFIIVCAAALVLLSLVAVGLRLGYVYRLIQLIS